MGFRDRIVLGGIAPALLLALTVLLLLVSLPAAEASQRLCRQLESELAALRGGGGGGSAQARKYDRAIEAQRDQIDKAMYHMSRAGCDGGGFLFNRGSSSGACAAISGSLDRMHRNLAALQRKRAQMGGGGNARDSRRERARLLASLDANDCRPVMSRDADPEDAARYGRRGNFFDQLFGDGITRRERLEDYDARENVRPAINKSDDDGSSEYGRLGGGTYRTLCVRTCDGYYFPISYSSSGSDFDRDQKNCETMCPGTEVKLFSHRVPEEESESMVAGDGTKYVDLTNAFKYRDTTFSRPATCGCNIQKGFTIIGGGEPSTMNPSGPAEEAVTVPVARPDPAADPETLANRNGRLDDEVIQRLLTSKPSAGAGAGDRKVRVVGPEYLPDPEAALDLRAPAPRAIQ